MNRTARKYTVELRVRDINGGTPVGSIFRFLYVDEEDRDWVKINGEWTQVDDRLEGAHCFVQEFPRDMEAA